MFKVKLLKINCNILSKRLADSIYEQFFIISQLTWYKDGAFYFKCIVMVRFKSIKLKHKLRLHETGPRALFVDVSYMTSISYKQRQYQQMNS